MPGVWGVIPSLRVENVAAALDFYVGTLGFELVRGTAEEDNVSIALGSARLMIERPAGYYSAAYNTAIRDRLPNRSALALYIEAADLEALYRRVTSAGIEIIDPLAERPWGQAEFTIADPAGTWLTFWQAAE